MLEQLEVVQADIPGMSSKFMKDFAKELYEQYQFFNNARLELTRERWPACIDAYQCVRELPEARAMDWADQGRQGETDIKDGVDFLSDALCLALLPRDETAFAVLSRRAEDQGLLNDLRDLVSSLCRRCDLRGEYAKHIKQTLILGTSAIHISWRKAWRLRQYSRAETVRRLAEIAWKNGLDFDISQINLLAIRFPELVINQPVVKLIDMFNLLLDPTADLTNDADLPMIQVTYKTVDELKNARDEDGNPYYDQKTLENITPLTLEEIYSWQSERHESIRAMGLNPTINMGQPQQGSRYVPVLVYHQMHRSFQGREFLDTYFHLALSGTSWHDARIVRAELNPNPNGGRNVFVDTYQDWIANTAYGTGVVEKSLPAYHHKNVISALTLNAQLATVFPAVTLIGGLLLDEAELELGPGGVNVIKTKGPWGPANFIAPIPAPQGGVQLGMMDQQFLGQKILGQMGAYGAILQDPTKTVSKSKTATQINTESTSGSVLRDNLLERMTIRTLEPLIQTIYDFARIHLEDDQIFFEKLGNSGMALGSVERDDLDQDRQIVVTGYHSFLNKAQEIDQLKEVLAILAQGNWLQSDPALMGVAQDTLFRLLGRLGVKDLEKYKRDLVDIILSTPQGQRLQQEMFMNGIRAVTMGLVDPNEVNSGGGMPPGMGMGMDQGAGAPMMGSGGYGQAA